MPQVSLIKSQIKNPHRFNIFLDGKFAFVASEDLLVKFKLVSKKFIEEKELESILFETKLSDLMDKVYGLFSFRPRTESEIRSYFKIQNYKLRSRQKEQISQIMIDLLIDRLKAKGLVNDLVFANAWVESRRRSKAKGVWALKSELFKKGVSREVMDQVIGARSEEDEESLARTALGKKMVLWQNLGKLEFRRKAIGFLQRQGFAYPVAKKVAFDAKKS